MSVNALYRKHDIRDVRLYMWPNEHGGMHVSKAPRLRQLRAQNSRLKLIMVVDDFMKELVTAEASWSKTLPQHWTLSTSRRMSGGLSLGWLSQAKPTHNAFIESCNGKPWDQHLNAHRFAAWLQRGVITTLNAATFSLKLSFVGAIRCGAAPTVGACHADENQAIKSGRY
jgi:hypothetical protein